MNRADFLRALESVQAGLSPKDLFVQSSHFLFQDGKVKTFNGEVACSVDLPFGNSQDTFEGAVRAGPLLALLRKLTEEDVELVIDSGELVIGGKRKKSGITLDAEVQNPVNTVEVPQTWKPLHEDFGDALSVVQECAGSDESRFVTTCVHLTPTHLEAFDNNQLARYNLKTGFSGKMLVKKANIKDVVPLDMTEFAETPKWLHFRNPGGLHYSVLRSTEVFPNLGAVIDSVGGEPASLPPGLGEACDKAAVFTAEDEQSDRVEIELRPGKLRLYGRGIHGWYSEVKRLEYNGPEVTFLSSPRVLM